MALPIFLGNSNKIYIHSLLNIRGIPYNPQTQDIVGQAHHTLKLQIKKGKYTRTLLSSLSRADFTRFQHNITYMQVRKQQLELDMEQQTKAEKHFKTLKDTSLPMSI